MFGPASGNAAPMVARPALTPPWEAPSAKIAMMGMIALLNPSLTCAELIEFPFLSAVLPNSARFPVRSGIGWGAL